MPYTHTSLNSPRINDDESINGPFKSARASNLGTTTSTATISVAALVKDLGLDATRTVTLALTDIAVYTDVSGSLLQVKSGADVIWQAYVGNTTGVYLDFEAFLVADKGADLTLALTGATTKCSVSFTARVIIGHVQ
jgi:hypothetical protein